MMLDKTYMPYEKPDSPTQDDTGLIVGSMEDLSHVAGPGVRSVVWVAGCHRRCPGCMKPDLFAFDAGIRVSVSEMFERLASIEKAEGVTFSGGEPFEQSLALAKVAKSLRTIGRNTLVYTGYRYEELINNSIDNADELLSAIDILIDGEFQKDLELPGRWRGSANQRLIALSGKGRELLAASLRTPASQDIQISANETQIRLTGCPDRTFFDQWLSELHHRGISVESSKRKMTND